MSNDRNPQLFDQDKIPGTLEQAAKYKWGSDVAVTSARENGNYAGPVIADGDFLAQKVSDRTVVVHEKTAIDFSQNDNMKARASEGRLNDVNISLAYEGKTAKAYYHDPEMTKINLMSFRMDQAAEKVLSGNDLAAFRNGLNEVKKHLKEEHSARKQASFEKRTGQDKPQPETPKKSSKSKDR